MDDSPTLATNDQSSAALQAGQTFGSYRIVRLLGQGGMGEVYEAEHLENGRRVALKTLRKSLARSQDRQRFLREGRLAASINHPNSVYIYGTEEIDGTPVITMELVSGGSLKERVEDKGTLPPAQAVDAILQVISGLEAAEALGVLHRDIKPSNLFIDADGTIKIGDFGLSVSTISMETQLTMTGTIMGTPMYAPPEQLRGDDLDVRSDIYSVGAALYFLLTKKPPFDIHEAVRLIAAVLQETPRSPQTIDHKIPSGLAAVVLRCLEKQPAARFASYEELRAALTPFSSTAPVPAPLGLRFGASFIDGLPSMIVGALIVSIISAGRTGVVLDLPKEYFLILTAFNILYSGCFEGWFGAGLGKAVCGIRVIGPGGGPPGFVRAAVRTSIHAALGWLTVTVMFLTGPHTAATLGIVSNIVLVINLALLFSTARRENGFAAVHDKLTGTRVVMKASIHAARRSQRSEDDSVHSSTASRIGPFNVIETLSSTAMGEVLLAYDPKLHRRVWIHRLLQGAPSVPDARRDLKRPTRLRLLMAKRSPDENWDAYGVVEGKPLATAAQTPQPWGAVRRWLLGLAEEIQQGVANVTSIERFSADQVWIGSDGRARLLEFPIFDTRAPANLAILKSGDLASAQDSLFRIAAAGLTGRMNNLTEPSAGLPAIPIPLNARRFLSDLNAGSARSFDDITRTLQSLNESEASVTRWRRAGNIIGFGMFFTFITIVVVVTGVIQTRQILQYPDAERLFRSLRQLTESQDTAEKAALKTYIAGRFRTTYFDQANWPFAMRLEFRRPFVVDEAKQIFTSTPIPTGPEVASAAARLNPFLARVEDSIVNRRSLSRFITVVLGVGMTVIGGFSIIGILLAFAFRGRGLITIFGITIVKADGTEITRLRALIRSLIAASPALIAMVGTWMSPAGAFTFRALILVFVFVLMITGAIVALRHPDRGIQDRIAGTALVPR